MSSAYELYIATTAQKGRDKTMSTKDGAQDADRNGQTKKPTDKGEDLNSPRKLCESFKRTLSREGVKVHFVGAWCVCIYQCIETHVVLQLMRITVAPIVFTMWFFMDMEECICVMWINMCKNPSLTVR